LACRTLIYSRIFVSLIRLSLSVFAASSSMYAPTGSWPLLS
jgi:hypothetical protein